MQNIQSKNKILILGASGYLGNAIYKELCDYFKTFGTYFSNSKDFKTNAHFFSYNIETDDIYNILNKTKPSVIISALRGNFYSQTLAHKHIIEYALEFDSKIIFLSSSNTFDAYSKYPSYEIDKTLSHSVYGHFKIKIENMLLRIPKKQVAILRLPMVFGAKSPRLNEIKDLISKDQAIEIFPNLIINVNLDKKITQQIHYIINQNKYGIFHLGSTDLIHHNEFIKSITETISTKKVKFKLVYTTNQDRYLAVLPKYNKLPKHLQITSEAVLKELQK